MNWLYNFLPESYVHALGWTVVHSLWQGTLIAAAMMLTMLGLQRQSAAMRYRMAFGSLVLMLLVAFSTFCFLFKKTTDTAENDLLQALILRGLASAETVGETSFFQRMGLFFNQNLSIIVAVWLSGVVFFSMRLVGGLWFIRQLQSSRQYVFLESEWQMRVNYFKNRLGIRQAVVLAESVLVNVPMVVGWLKPLILLPIGTANAMSTAQVEAILAHELAHVAARDFLLNIVQSFIEIIFFYHPAAWWISAIVRTERENRCDDIAVQLCGNSLVYAKALLSLQEMQTSNARTFGLAMTLAGKSGGKRNGLLLNRIKRILKQPQNRSNIMEKLTATGLLLAVVTALSFGSNHFSQQNVSKTGHSVSALVKTTENDTTPRRDTAT